LKPTDIDILNCHHRNDTLDLSQEENFIVINNKSSSQLNRSRNLRMFKPKTTISGRLENSSGGAIRTHGLRVMSNAPESVPFVQRVLQTLAPAASARVSQTDERWFLLTRHAAVVDRYSYSI